MSARRQLLGCMLAATLVATASGAHAETPADAREQERTALYEEGMALANAGRWDQAVVRFRQVVAIRSAPPALFTLAQAEEHIGRLATAERAYASALRDARAAGNAKVTEEAAKALAAIEPRVPRIVVRVAAPAPPSASATMDGANVALDEPIWVDPGEHVIAVRAPDRRPFESRVVAKPGESSEVSARLEPAAIAQPAPPVVAPPVTTTPAEATPAAAPEEPREPPVHRATPVGPLLLAGGGAIAGAVGLVMRLQAQPMTTRARTAARPVARPRPGSIRATRRGRACSSEPWCSARASRQWSARASGG